MGRLRHLKPIRTIASPKSQAHQVSFTGLGRGRFDDAPATEGSQWMQASNHDLD